LVRNFKKLIQDLEDWRNWCMDNPNESRGHIAYHLEEILNITRGEKK